VLDVNDRQFLLVHMPFDLPNSTLWHPHVVCTDLDTLRYSEMVELVDIAVSPCTAAPKSRSTLPGGGRSEQETTHTSAGTTREISATIVGSGLILPY
jgi:hypothetical protein